MSLDHLESVTFETYATQPTVAGVWRKPLKKFHSLEGSFMEFMRLSDGQAEESDCPFTPRQLSFSWAVPGRINAFHLHPRERQDELWCVVQGGLQVWLVDLRPDSPSRGVRQRLFLCGDEPAWLYIPHGVAHGYRAGHAGALLVYATNSQLNWDCPNEGRLPYDYFGPELWEDNRG